MSFPAPILDDRSYAQLRDELVRRIPVYAPEWTHHNASDPGIALIELFAFLGENLLYRFNQIPEATRLEFLRLLRIPRRAAQSSRSMLVLDTDAAEGVLVEAGSEARAGAIGFEIQTETHVWPVSSVTVGRVRTAAPDPALEPEVHEFTLRALDAAGGLREDEEAVYYRNGVVSDDDSLPPVDFDATVDGILWIAVLARDPESRDASTHALAKGLLNIGFVPDIAMPGMNEVGPCPGTGPGATSPAVEWEISRGTLAGDGSPHYAPLTVAGDSTRGLTREGVVRLRLPDAADFGPIPAGDADLLGTRTRPPSLDDDTEARVLFWLRAYRRTEEAGRFGKVRLVSVNATEAVQQQAARLQVLGTGTAQPDQEYALLHKPVIAGSLRLEVEEAGVWKSWTEIDGFHASGPEDRHFVVDLQAGKVRFGNGLRGQAPQIGQRIRALSYRYGGGAAGNVGAQSIDKLTSQPSVKPANPMAAYGGADGESIEAALDRIPGELRRRDRAVTQGDFQELALATPGAAVGRAECLPLFHPPTLSEGRPGVVTVVVWPAEDRRHPTAPRPDRNLIHAVCQWLDGRRLVTTELYVVPPTYRKVSVAVGLKVKDGYGAEAVRRWVELILRRYLAPLPPYGPEGQGWPLGRRVHGPELEAAALQVEGVEYLEDLKVAGWDATTATWQPGTVILRNHEVPELTGIAVVEGPLTFEAGTPLSPPPTDTVPVPIPVLRDEC
ncbi:MAG: putative baseplate assembly protein [Verrucomicrobiae bacterium]|nr:putative baseplate assembly protein [Verrucomicrobiae bacterium]